jgi:hypothetical protein
MAEAFAPELEDAAPSARRALAGKLLEEAAKMPDAPADAFVVLGGAIESAVEAGDLPLALKAADQMAEQYDLDGLAVRVGAALKLPPRSYPANAGNAPAALELLEALESAEDYAVASRLVAVLEQVPDPSLHAVVLRRAAGVEELRAARERLTVALEKLKSSPADPAANLAVGRYTALLRGDWEHGLPFLAKGDDPKLAALANATLANPAGTDAHVNLANEWWELGLASTGRAATSLLQRAADEYQIAEPGLSGLALMMAGKRVADADAAVAAAGRPTGTVHLLSLVDERELTEEGWSRQGTGVVTDRDDSHVLTLPYLAPDEYDLKADFARLTNNNDIIVAFPVGRGTCDFSVGAHNNKHVLLGRIRGDWDSNNPTMTPGGVPNNERHSMEIKVRRDGVEACLDGKRVCYWQTNGDDLISYRWFMHSPGFIALTGWKGKVAFYSVDLTALHGAGTVARERDADGWFYNPMVIRPSGSGAIELSARDVTIHGYDLAYDGKPGQQCIAYWTSTDAYLTWFVDVPRAGDYTLEAGYGCSDGNDGSEVEFGLEAGKDAIASSPLTLHVQDTGGWWHFRTEPLGKLHLPAGRQTLLVKAKSKPHASVMNLRSVVLTPVR